MSTGHTIRQRVMAAPIQAYWNAVDCGFELVANVFEDCIQTALAVFTPEQMNAYIDAARVLGKLGRGPEPMLAFLKEWPGVCAQIEQDPLPPVMAFVRAMQKSPNGPAITPFLQSLETVARRLRSRAALTTYLDIARDLMSRTTGSIHGFQQTHPSPGLPEFFAQAPVLFAQVSIGGIAKWVEYGVRNYASHPERQIAYFSLQSADSRAVLQRERQGTLFADVERQLDLTMRALWQISDRDGSRERLVPYSTAYDEIRKPIPYYDHLGMRVPDAQDEAGEIKGIDRYRAILAHMVGHRRWSQAIVADNYSPLQRMAIEFFEDCRIETLLLREYPGLRRIFLGLHPQPREDACDPENQSCLRHRLAVLSRALLDAEHAYRDPLLLKFVQRFHAILANDESSTAAIAELALAYATASRRQSDQFAKIHFDDTVIDYRDDNRNLWIFIEAGDEEESFAPERKAAQPTARSGLPPRHYPEWDYASQTYRPDWVTVYEALHPRGDAAAIDTLLAQHSDLAKHLQRLFDLLKPQEKQRIRYQEDGSELDLDIALRSLIDFKSGATPDPRINMSHQSAGRDIAVLLLLDLSASLNDKVPGSEQTVLELSQAAVSLLAWAIDRLGDPLAIAGFHSNTRHDVRYYHLKGFSERWGDEAKSRLAAIEAGFSTRMGAALRHAGHYLGAQKTDKKLLLILTDGQPSDVDSQDQRLLIDDARQAVRELARENIFTYCISLDRDADAYVADIFGRRYSVIDQLARLPQRLPELFMALTR